MMLLTVTVHVHSVCVGIAGGMYMPQQNVGMYGNMPMASQPGMAPQGMAPQGMGPNAMATNPMATNPMAQQGMAQQGMVRMQYPNMMQQQQQQVRVDPCPCKIYISGLCYPVLIIHPNHVLSHRGKIVIELTLQTWQSGVFF